MATPQYKSRDIPIITVCPNWTSEVTVREDYETIIREALDVSEQRICRRPRCLYGLNFQTLGLTGQETGYLRAMVELAEAMPVGMPFWTEATKLTAGVGIGAGALVVDTIADTLFPLVYDYVILWSAFNVWEICAASAASGTSITLSQVTTLAWPTGTFVIPLLFGKLPRNRTNQLTDEHGVFTADFEERFNRITYQGRIA